MAQPNVAREPSMEEILASIRRIIESNEPQAENALHDGLPPVYDIDEDEIEIVAEMAANDPGQPRFSETAQAAASEGVQERSLSLADVAARVRAASARQVENGTVRLPTPPAGFSEPVVQSSDLKAPFAVPVDSAPLRPQTSGSMTNDALTRASVVSPNIAPLPEQVRSPAAEPLVQPSGAIAVARAEPVSLPAKVEAAAALLSEEAGAQVARSFGELAAVFDGIANRSIEDMTQEMLRPMLQEWLDDNLPTLVERLVREEIERVARGPRR